MKRFVSFLIVILSMTSWGYAQEEPQFIPVHNENFQIKAMIPAGWNEASPGFYMRSDNLDDIAGIAVQAAPIDAETLLASILPQFGLTEAPQSIGTTDTGLGTWTLYQFEVEFNDIHISFDLALTTTEQTTYLVLLQALSSDYEDLHETIFETVLASVEPLVIDEDLPYIAEEVTFQRDDVTLAGTLTLPEGDGPFPVLVLVSGSGPQDRDENAFPIAEIKPFRLIADYLTQHGIAVLRYDDQGVGGSTGEIDATIEENIANASAAVDYVLTRDEINPDAVGLLGHSEGGLAVARLGATHPDLDFVISMAGTALNGKDILFEQNQRIYESEGQSEESLARQLAFLEEFFALIDADDSEALAILVNEHVRQQVNEDITDAERASLGDIEAYVETQSALFMEQYNGRWFRSFLDYNPITDWEQVTIPVLAVFGGLDVQVPADVNGVPLEAALELAGNQDFTIVTLDTANHLFQEAEIGALSEYFALGSEFHPEFLPLITDWILEQSGQ